MIKQLNELSTTKSYLIFVPLSVALLVVDLTLLNIFITNETSISGFFVFFYLFSFIISFILLFSKNNRLIKASLNILILPIILLICLFLNIWQPTAFALSFLLKITSLF